MQLARPGAALCTPLSHKPAAIISPTGPRAPGPPPCAVGDLARRFGLGAEMISAVLSTRVASGLVRGKMDAGVIYTAAYLARIKAQLR